MAGDGPIRLVLADDHPIVLRGLEQLLALEPDLSVVASCRNGAEALEAVRAQQPDVLVLDLKMPDVDGQGVLQALHEEKATTRVVILSAALDEQALLEAVRLGVKGVVLKEMAPELLIQCIRKVHSGGQWLDQDLVGRALETLLARETDQRRIGELLTPREIEIARLVAAGLSNKEIARELSITEGTVKVHVHNIYEKLGIDGRVELANYARHHGIL
ncbi:MAG: response regulator transcription factor [Rhodospirillales bacterium]|nr:response regulator transcription factor [Rhodospirillales bacterium]